MIKKTALFLSLWLCQTWALSCSDPIIIAEAKSIIAPLSTVLNEKGDVMVIWRDNIDNPHEPLKYIERDTESGWSVPSIIPWSGGEISLQRVFMDIEGNVFLGGKLEKAPAKKTFLQFIKKEKNRSWSDVVDVVRPEDNFKTAFAGAFDPQGNILYAGIRDEDPFDYEKDDSLWMFQYQHQSANKISRPIYSSSKFLSVDELVVNKLGDRFFVSTHFNSSSSSYKELAGLWIKDGKTKENLFPICKLRKKWLYFHLRGSMNSQKNAALIWVRKADSVCFIEAILSVNGKWQEPIELFGSTDTLSTRSKPNILIDEQGNVVALWVMNEKKGCVIYGAYKLVGEPWSLPKAISSPTKYNHRLVLKKSGGKFVVVWDEVDTKGGAEVHGAILETSTQKGSTAILSPPGQKSYFPSFDVNEKGLGVVSWVTEKEGKSQIQIAELNLN